MGNPLEFAEIAQPTLLLDYQTNFLCTHSVPKNGTLASYNAFQGQCPQLNTGGNMMNAPEQKGFSWMGLLFGGAYYAGYGQFVKGLIMAAISFIPLTAIPVNIYAGIKAKKQLPVGAHPFEWPKASLVFLIPIILGGAALFFAQGGGGPYTEADFRADMSGYWIVDSSKAEWGFDMRQKPYALIINGRRSPIEMVQFNPADAEGICFMALRLSNGKLIGLTMGSNDHGLMILTASGAQSDTLRFSRRL
jgi:hypothetical protein